MTNHVWLSPKAALEKYDTKEVKLAPPTWVMVAELSRLRSLADVEKVGRAGRDMRYVRRSPLPNKVSDKQQAHHSAIQIP